jgi:hypothetical protein
MAKRKKNDYQDPREKLIAGCNLKDLKRACIVRGMTFARVVESSALELQSWVFKNYYNPTEPQLLQDYDIWLDKYLQDLDVTDEPIHIDLRMGYYSLDEDGNKRGTKRNTLIVGAYKSEKEQARFKPKKGTKKEYTFELFERGYSTKEVIEMVVDRYPDVSEGSIKVWGSRFRKTKKLRDKHYGEES